MCQPAELSRSATWNPSRIATSGCPGGEAAQAEPGTVLEAAGRPAGGPAAGGAVPRGPATGEVVARRVAEFLGFDALIATRHARQTGRFDGHMAGLPIFREGKIDGVEAWLRGRGASLATLADSSFYSDSRNDRFLMERVRRPVAVGPDEELRALSMERGWEILEIR